jgi:hypothetical protein
MRHEWAQFLSSLEIPYEFLHRDELKERFIVEGVRLPTVFKQDDDGLVVWIDARAINSWVTKE